LDEGLCSAVPPKFPLQGSHRNNGSFAAAVVPPNGGFLLQDSRATFSSHIPERPSSLRVFLSCKPAGQVLPTPPDQRFCRFSAIFLTIIYETKKRVKGFALFSGLPLICIIWHTC